MSESLIGGPVLWPRSVSDHPASWAPPTLGGPCLCWSPFGSRSQLRGCSEPAGTCPHDSALSSPRLSRFPGTHCCPGTPICTGSHRPPGPLLGPLSSCESSLVYEALKVPWPEGAPHPGCGLTICFGGFCLCPCPGQVTQRARSPLSEVCSPLWLRPLRLEPVSC